MTDGRVSLKTFAGFKFAALLQILKNGSFVVKEKEEREKSCQSQEGSTASDSKLRACDIMDTRLGNL